MQTFVCTDGINIVFCDQAGIAISPPNLQPIVESGEWINVIMKP